MSSSEDDYNSSRNVSMYKTLSSRAMMLAIIVLFCVVIFMLFLHLIAKWYWRYIAIRRMSRRRGFIVVRSSAGHQQQVGEPGLDQSVIDSLPTFSYHARSSPGDENDDVKSSLSSCECAVCLSEFREAEKGRTLPGCNHSFHVDCIDMWLHSHSTCPLCRADVLSSKLSKEQTICQQDTCSLPVSAHNLDNSMPMPVFTRTMLAPTSTPSISPTIPSSPMQSMSVSMSSVSVSASASSFLPDSQPNAQQVSSNEMQFDHVISISVTPCANNGNDNNCNNNIVFFNEDINPISEVNSPLLEPTSPTPDISIDICPGARQHPWQKVRCFSMPRSCHSSYLDWEPSSNSQPGKPLWIFRQSFKLGPAKEGQLGFSHQMLRTE